MLAGARYSDADPELVALRKACGHLCDEFNAVGSDEDARRTAILTDRLGGLGSDSWIMPRFRCDYGFYITIGSNSFLNYDAVLLDCAPIT
ncbi:MAG: maltose acetyltransferase domain-containing protein, partial [Gordonia sp. (in: high G+C Gram-positive bacteria)]